MNERLRRTLEFIDDANRGDPTVEIVDGHPWPKALLYGRRMTEWLHRLESEPSAALEIAARAQHIGRWKVPRTQFPATRSGYLAWRTHLYGFHAEQVSAILRQLGYPKATIEHVVRIVAKHGLKRDADVQRIEDVACLVFLNYEFAQFAVSHPRDKIIAIVRKTWNKMSEDGRKAASELSLPESLSHLIADALAS